MPFSGEDDRQWNNYDNNDHKDGKNRETNAPPLSVRRFRERKLLHLPRLTGQKNAGLEFKRRERGSGPVGDIKV